MFKFNRSSWFGVALTMALMGWPLPSSVRAQDLSMWVTDYRKSRPVYSNPKDAFAATWNRDLAPKNVPYRRLVTAHWDAARSEYSYVDASGRMKWIAGTAPGDWTDRQGWYHHFDGKGVEWITKGGKWQFYKVPRASNWQPVRP